MAIGAGRLGVGQAGIERLPVGVQVGQQGELHGAGKDMEAQRSYGAPKG